MNCFGVQKQDSMKQMMELTTNLKNTLNSNRYEKNYRYIGLKVKQNLNYLFADLSRWIHTDL